MPRRGLAQSFGSVSKQIAEAAKGGAETNIPGFGKFKVKEKAAPGDGCHDADRGLEAQAFTPAKAARDALNGCVARFRDATPP